MKKTIKKLLCLVLALAMMFSVFTISTSAASYPLVVIKTRESSHSVVKGEIAMLEFMVMPEYKNEGYIINMYDSDGNLCANTESEYYNSDGTISRDVTITINTGDLDLDVGRYKIEYQWKYYTYFAWRLNPRSGTHYLDIVEDTCNGKHTIKVDSVIEESTCEEQGWASYKCTKCGYYEYRDLPLHVFDNDCDKECNKCDFTRETTHEYETKYKKATQKASGESYKQCINCNKKTSISTVYKIKTVKLSKKEFTYNGKTQKPNLIVKDSKGKTISSKYYTVSGNKNKKVGKHTVTIKFKTKYSGTVKLDYKINPAKTSVKTVSAAKKSLKVTVKKKSSEVTGYQIQYSTSKKFSSKYTKTKTISSYKTTSATLKSLKAKKTYYVKVRTYKTVKGKKYYSAWSSVKTKKTK